MDELIGGIFHLITRFLIWFLLDIFFQIICWSIGWGALKFITLGAYPKKSTSEEAVGIFGVVILILVLIGTTFYFYFNG